MKVSDDYLENFKTSKYLTDIREKYIFTRIHYLQILSILSFTLETTFFEEEQETEQVNTKISDIQIKK